TGDSRRSKSRPPESTSASATALQALTLKRLRLKESLDCHVSHHSIPTGALVRDSEGWFVLMDAEESSTLFHPSYATSSLMGWRDSSNTKHSETEDEIDESSHSGIDESSHSGRDDTSHSGRIDSDTESQKSMIQSFSTNARIFSDHADNWPQAETATASPANIPKLALDESTTQEPKQTLDESISTTIYSMPETSNSLGTSTAKVPDDQSVELTVLSSSLERPASPKIVNKKNSSSLSTTQEPKQNFDETTSITISSLPDTSNSLGTSTAKVPDNQSVELAMLSSSPERPASPKIVNEKDSSTFSINLPKSPGPSKPLSVLSELLDRFGDLICIELFHVEDDQLPSLASSIQGRVLQKIWLMFQTQALAVGLGNLGLSIMISLLVRFGAPRQVRVQLDEMVMIVGDFVAHL
ncbi:hypothetical protein EV361DRAFT_982840, partial [Lentinula raphanica]